MYTITYVSSASPKLEEQDIYDLFDFVKQFNNANRITGILIYSEGNFFQVLEGEEKQVRELYDKIEKDSRHYDLIQLLSKKISHISFSYYASFFTIVSDKLNASELNKFLRQEKQYNPLGFENIKYMVRNFMPLL